VFVGVALRDGNRYGIAGAISRCGLLHVECDRPDGQERTGALPLRPQLLVAFGTLAVKRAPALVRTSRASST
jgi:hypothetical protein